ncbi:MAG: NosD domain-containing protein [Candidatus Heimdallarchaeaceae archaeon]
MIRKKLTFVIVFALSINIIFNNPKVLSNVTPEVSVLTNHDPIYISSDSDFTVFPGSGTKDDPYIIEGYNIASNNRGTCGISIYGTTKYFIIRNCNIEANGICIHINKVSSGTAIIINNIFTTESVAISLYSSSNCTIANNTCIDNINSINIRYSVNCTVVNNTCIHSSSHTGLVGISLYYSSSSIVANNICKKHLYHEINLEHSFNCIIENNICQEGGNGICLLNSSNSLILNNTCANNIYDGISLSNSSYGFILNNICSQNNIKGIDLFRSSNSTVINNLLLKNNEHGIGICSDNNTVYHNSFIRNRENQHLPQALDCGKNNKWYSTETLEGNYWSNYDGSGNYTLDGGLGYVDPYPLSSFDFDGDTMPDEWEVENYLDPTTDDTSLDHDSDGLNNLEEYKYNTHPYRNDTDKDNLIDGEEVKTYGTNPVKADTDGDGYSDGEEVKIYGTDPLNPDEHPHTITLSFNQIVFIVSFCALTFLLSTLFV